ncbi:type VI secretion system baseplate subunit TssG [Aromatoleum diolicum]|uniref:Type VI secretion system baseplate subunit TssG n=1 Tax=Aromatoleum diolicum TaxID=75796 RepID=A0ABX1QGH5_9RHOO|nr:type VI secretion system baseplate subunit TssG [Aromatoleum diolicum]NMG77542.1 type VI secretion system baseplate subunit TssG [Aromatoleum diolicum]
MRASNWRFDPGLIDQLIETPHRFEFFQAVRVLDRVFRTNAEEGLRAEDPLSGRIRFRNTLNLGFAPAQIEALHPIYAQDADGRSSTALRRVEITPYFMGMLGLHGALPTHYTERIAERERYHRDRAARAFVDIFSNRSVAQFYQAWKKYRLPLQYESDRKNHFVPLVMALGGLGFPSLRNRLNEAPGAIDDEAIAHFSSLLAQRPLSALALQRILSRYFRVPVRVEQFVGKWYLLPAEQRSALGGRNAALGKTALVGERVWQRNLRVRLHIGPLACSRYGEFLPGGELAAALEKLMTLATGFQFEYEIRPILRASEVRPAALVSGAPARLGRDAFLSTRCSDVDRSDAVFELHPIN